MGLQALVLIVGASPGVLGATLMQPPGRLLRRAVRQPALALSLSEQEEGEEPAGTQAPRNLKVTVLKKMVHQEQPWTQGLEYWDGKLIETSGAYPQGVGSFVRILDPATGQIVRKVTDGLQQPIFLEGITRVGDRWYVITYEDKVALEYDSQFKPLGRRPYPLEGWGFTRSPDAKTFLATNGSEFVMTIEPSTYRVLSAKPATCMGKRVAGINELEMVDNFLGRGPALLGNVMDTRVVLVLDPVTAVCTAAFHLNELGDIRSDESFGFHVANGVAYNKDKDTFFVTGKNWASLFEIKVTDEPAPAFDGRQALDMLLAHVSGQ